MFFFFNDTATTEIYTLSLHDALPIYRLRHLPREHGRRVSRSGAHRRRSIHRGGGQHRAGSGAHHPGGVRMGEGARDRKSTRLNSSHGYISYAVFCLKKKKKKNRMSCAATKTDKARS